MSSSNANALAVRLDLGPLFCVGLCKILEHISNLEQEGLFRSTFKRTCQAAALFRFGHKLCTDHAHLPINWCDWMKSGPVAADAKFAVAKDDTTANIIAAAIRMRMFFMASS